MGIGRWVLVGCAAGLLSAGNLLAQDACTVDEADELALCIEDATFSCLEAYPTCDEPSGDEDISADLAEALSDRCLNKPGTACKACLNAVKKDLKDGALRGLGKFVLPELNDLIAELTAECPAAGSKKGGKKGDDGNSGSGRRGNDDSGDDSDDDTDDDSDFPSDGDDDDFGDDDDGLPGDEFPDDFGGDDGDLPPPPPGSRFPRR